MTVRVTCEQHEWAQEWRGAALPWMRSCPKSTPCFCLQDGHFWSSALWAYVGALLPSRAPSFLPPPWGLMTPVCFPNACTSPFGILTLARSFSTCTCALNCLCGHSCLLVSSSSHSALPLQGWLPLLSRWAALLGRPGSHTLFVC